MLRAHLDQGGDVLVDQLVKGIEQRMVLLPIAGRLRCGVLAL